MTESEFSIPLQLRIDWGDLDYFGHVNNVSFFKYIQASIVNYWDNVGLTKNHCDTNIGPILVSSSCRFRKPLFYPGKIIIQAKVDFIKNTSFGISHKIIDDKNEIAAEAQDVMVMFDFNKNEKVLFPNELKERINQIEKLKF